jgi:hypothetical protein
VIGVVGIIAVRVITVRVITVRVITVRVITVGVITMRVITVRVITVGVITVRVIITKIIEDIVRLHLIIALLEVVDQIHIEMTNTKIRTTIGTLGRVITNQTDKNTIGQ